MPKKTIRAKCIEAAQLLSRVSEADDNGYCTCVSCGAYGPWNEFDGGHFIPKGASSYWVLELENIHPQCKGCNGFGMKFGDASQRYTLWMEDYYGRDFVDNMLATKSQTRKMYKRDYEELLKEFNEQIKFHKKRIGAA